MKNLNNNHAKEGKDAAGGNMCPSRWTVGLKKGNIYIYIYIYVCKYTQ
jgi:hypothetical protein